MTESPQPTDENFPSLLAVMAAWLVGQARTAVLEVSGSRDARALTEEGIDDDALMNMALTQLRPVMAPVQSSIVSIVGSLALEARDQVDR